MMTLDRPLIVEGRYDKIKVASIARGVIVTTDGFGVFSSEEKVALIRRLAEKKGVIVLTDSDGAGLVIRNYIKNILPPDKIVHLYTPEVYGKEKRKKVPSKAGILGVEGTDIAILKKLLSPYFTETDAPAETPMALTKAMLYEIGLCGGDNAAEKRRKLAKSLDLPGTLSANALLEAVNWTVTEERWQAAVDALSEEKKTEE